ncbi:ScbR family autoregulator-binding transcription factor, partial [Streptomyces olivochromogenes]|uniref:ScbR family autoregulator-binding transcription factor n=1 Tax=Streptomyces olivochromogenes TaxID=1963 RepID=UPI001FCA6640
MVVVVGGEVGGVVRQVRAVRTRRALVRAAAEVFAEDGYALASLPVISRRAGVSTGALHFHFPSKDLLAREVEAVATVSVQRLVVREGAGGGGLQLLVDVSGDLVAALAVDPVLRAGFELGGDPSRKSAEGPGRWWGEWVYALLREAQGAGELARGVSPEAAAVAVVASVAGLGRLASRHRVRSSSHLVEQFWALLLPGLAAPSRRRPVLPGPRSAGTGRTP